MSYIKQKNENSIKMLNLVLNWIFRFRIIIIVVVVGYIFLKILNYNIDAIAIGVLLFLGAVIWTKVRF